ncbi:DUF1615 family protein [Thiothrix litoralis]|uniref:DUF1615 family protein n=3 Tax=Thiotrichaceae TaxID=135617 RepID=A0ABY9MU49_9GAMM|nr:DUF1615 family protein [Thiothrix lacustris]QTR48293.1 DUF1615 family protein [Thiothrix litoralis]WML91686.1 DUF1615 family protein [Thiothrix lacustris]WMP16453.1 DUF1615 family protein [Thiothrix lacustris]
MLKRLARWLMATTVLGAVVGVGMWVYPAFKQYWMGEPAKAVAVSAPPSVGLLPTVMLIKAAEPAVADPRGWASDVLDVLKLHGLPQSRENVCSIIAVADQESGFVANPTVPNLGKSSEKAVIEKLSKLSILRGGAITFLNRFPDPADSFMQRIRRAKTERDLDLAYRALVAGLEDYARRYKLGLLLDNHFASDLIEGSNEIDTIGSMQVAVNFAVQYETQRRGGKALSLQEIYQVRDSLYTRKGGLFYGALLLLGYESGYDKKLYRFADFNAGRYSSRNAAFQAVIGVLSKQTLATDGDLLMYKADGSVASKVSGTEQALRYINQAFALNLKESQIRRDLMQEKTLSFNNTTTYKLIRATYAKATGKAAVYAQVPNIQLHSEKTSRILTTGKFANTVYGRYQRCLAAR